MVKHIQIVVMLERLGLNAREGVHVKVMGMEARFILQSMIQFVGSMVKLTPMPVMLEMSRLNARECVLVQMILVHVHLITNLFVEGTARHIPIIALLGVKKCEGLVKEDAPALDPDRNQLFSENELTLLVGTDLV